MSTHTDETTVRVVNNLCHAASRMNLARFCQALGWEQDDYAAAKFRDFQQAARLLGRFDNNVLSILAAMYQGEDNS